MPSTTAMDTTKALDIRPILLNVMRFLNPRRRPHCDTPSAASNSVEIRILSLIVEAAATLRHFREKLSSQRVGCHFRAITNPGWPILCGFVKNGGLPQIGRA